MKLVSTNEQKLNPPGKYFLSNLVGYKFLCHVVFVVCSVNNVMCMFFVQLPFDELLSGKSCEALQIYTAPCW
uniref:Uncharacterized protein n=1 Tax=Anguilla anguilla TaxID=7936 RepID=A0A0E9WHJ4_ANGAN